MKKSSLVLYVIAGICILTLGIARVVLATWMPFMWILIGAFLLAIGFAVAADLRVYKDFLSMKTTKRGFSMGSIALMTFALLVAINYLGAKKYQTYDFSASQLNTLSEQSLKVLKSVKSDIKVMYFYQEGGQGVEENKQAFTNLLKKYQDNSTLLKLEFVEVNERPDITEKFEVTQPGVVLIEYKGRNAKIEKIDEQELTSAIVKVSRETDKKIYFVTGHGERDLGDEGTGRGLGALKKLLQGGRYVVENLNLVTTPKVPDDANVVAIIGPVQTFLESELKTLEGYINSGGAVFLAIESIDGTNLKGFLNSLGLSIDPEHIVLTANTPMGTMVDPRQTVVDGFPAGQSITKPFSKGQAVLMKLPKPIVRTAQTSADLVISDLLTTNVNMLGFSNLDFKTAERKPGPFVVGVTIDKKIGDKSASLVVVSDSDVLSNEMLYLNLNRDLALNSFSTLAKEENLVSIAPREVAVTKIDLPEAKLQERLNGLQLLFYLPLPFLFLFVGLYFFFKRRFA